jgi:hypothetical protein
MTAHIYNLATTAASSISMNPLLLVALTAVVLVIATGLAGRLGVLCEDLRYTWLLGRNR